MQGNRLLFHGSGRSKLHKVPLPPIPVAGASWRFRSSVISFGTWPSVAGILSKHPGPVVTWGHWEQQEHEAQGTPRYVTGRSQEIMTSSVIPIFDFCSIILYSHRVISQSSHLFHKVDLDLPTHRASSFWNFSINQPSTFYTSTSVLIIPISSIPRHVNYLTKPLINLPRNP